VTLLDYNRQTSALGLNCSAAIDPQRPLVSIPDCSSERARPGFRFEIRVRLLSFGRTSEAGIFRCSRWCGIPRQQGLDTQNARGLSPARFNVSWFLELLADLSVDRIGAAAAHGDGEQNDANQENIFVTAGPDGISLRQMVNDKRNAHFDRECRGEEARE
jgi:hypothetical protein